jgi:hypothetical protein
MGRAVCAWLGRGVMPHGSLRCPLMGDDAARGADLGAAAQEYVAQWAPACIYSLCDAVQAEATGHQR